MDSESLPALAQLLSGTTGPSVRATACATVAACCNGKEGEPLREQIGTSLIGETIIRRLLLLSSDRQSGRLALSALINLSETESCAETIIRSAGVERCTTALLDHEGDTDGEEDGEGDGEGGERAHASLYSGLLSNLTRVPAGVDALVGKGKDASAANAAALTLLRLVTRVDRLPHVLWMANACSTPEGRAALLLKRRAAQSEQHDYARKGDEDDKKQQPLTWLLRLLTSRDDATRLAAASAVRNCAMADDCHDVLVNHTNALGVCLATLIGPRSNLPLHRVANAPAEVRAVAADPSKLSPEPLVEIRLLIVDALLLLCKTTDGRAALRHSDAYAVLSEWVKQEKDDHIKASATSIMQRITAVDDHQPLAG